jgi:hypothetical protein
MEVQNNHARRKVHAMAIVTQNPDEIKTSETVSSFMRQFGIAKLLARCGAYKEKGIPVFELFLAVFQNIFADRSMYRQMKTGKWNHDFSKNTVYDSGDADRSIGNASPRSSPPLWRTFCVR